MSEIKSKKVVKVKPKTKPKAKVRKLGRPIRKTVVKERLELGAKISEKYAEGKYTLESVCANFGVALRTFHAWASPDPADFKELPEVAKKLKRRGGYVAEVAKLYAKAKQTFKLSNESMLKDRALTGLNTLLGEGFIEETITEFIPGPDKQPTQKLMRKIKRTRLPNPTAVIFALKNLYPDTYSDVTIQRHEGSLTTGVDKFPDEALKKIIRGVAKLGRAKAKK